MTKTADVVQLNTPGDGNLFQLLSSTSCNDRTTETRAMTIFGLGVLVRVTTLSPDGPAEALEFVPGAMVAKAENGHLYLRQAVTP